MDRASVFGTEGWGFESLQARQDSCQVIVVRLQVETGLWACLFCLRLGEENGDPDAGWIGAGAGDAVAAVSGQEDVIAGG